MSPQVTTPRQVRQRQVEDSPKYRSNDRIVVFTDVDGTLLDHNYKVGVPKAILEQTFEMHSVVMVSSRTISELFALQEKLGLFGECIAENGGVVATYTPLPNVREDAWDWEVGGPGLLAVQRLASPAGETIELVREAADLMKVPLTLLTDFTPEEIAERHGYDIADAERSLDRRVSVLIDPSVTRSPGAPAFFDALKMAGCSVLFGGRWISVVRGADKGSAVRAYLAALRARGEQVSYSVGIGNEMNDAALLSTVDRPFVIRNPESGHVRELAAIPKATLLSRIGCAGWQEMANTLPGIRRSTNHPQHAQFDRA
jgi:mannosyl-3-phosphoglycerate phosphatase